MGGRLDRSRARRANIHMPILKLELSLWEGTWHVSKLCISPGTKVQEARLLHLPQPRRKLGHSRTLENVPLTPKAPKAPPSPRPSFA